jgi:hypothetical protein
VGYRSTLNVSGPSFRLVEIVWRFSAFVKSERLQLKKHGPTGMIQLPPPFDHTHHDAPGRRPHIA